MDLLDSHQFVEDLAEAHDRLRTFLERWPLQRNLLLEFPEERKFAPSYPKAIHRACPQCGRQTTWQKGRDQAFGGPGNLLLYTCQSCTDQQVYFWVTRRRHRSDEERRRALEAAESDQEIVRPYRLQYRKFGQHPPPDISVSKEIRAALDSEQLDFYKKALISLEHGHGLAAVSYMRRVVEEATSDFLDLIEDAADSTDNEELVEEVATAREQTHAEERLKLAAQILPDTLRPGGVNPLSVLYDNFSGSLHGLSDQECLEVAQKLRFGFDHMFENVRSAAKKAERFKEDMHRFS